MSTPTVPSSTCWIPYVTTSVPQVLPVTFVFSGAADLLVLSSRTSPPTVLTLNSDYSVSGGNGSTGSITTIAGGLHGLEVGDVITVTRRVALTQLISFMNGGPFTPTMVADGLNKLTEIAQQLNLVGANSLQFQADEALSGVLPLAQRKNAFLAFDSLGRQWFPTAASIVTIIDNPLSALTIAALRAIPVAGFATGINVQVLGYLAPNDGGGGLFVYNASSSATDDNGTIIQPTVGTGRWLRDFSGPINVRWFGAKGIGTDDTTAVQAAIDFATVDAWAVYFPAGNYGISATLTQTVPIRYFGDGCNAVDFAASPTVITKAASLNGPLFLVSQRGTALQNFSCIGVAGNAGDGIVVWANDVIMGDLGVFQMGRDGIRIGKDSGSLPSINANTWRATNVRCAYNVRHGFYVDDKLIGATDANAGLANGITCSQNGGDGIREQNAISNTYVGILCEGNTGYGINFCPTAANSLGSAAFGGDCEGNGAGGVENVKLNANTLNYIVMLSPNIIGAPFIDLGANNRIIPEGGASGNDCIARFTYGEAFAANSKYEAFAADGVDRLRVGWSNKAIAASQVAAQILADSLALRYITRADAAATHAFYAGLANDLLMTIGTDDVKIAKQLTIAAGTAGAPGLRFALNLTTGISDPGGPAIEFPVGGTRAAFLDGTALVLTGALRVSTTAATVKSGSGAPEGVVTASPGSLYMRTNPADKDTTVYEKVSGAGNTGWNAIAGV